MNDRSGSIWGGRTSKKTPGGVRKVRGLAPGLVALFLLLVAVPLGVSGPVGAAGSATQAGPAPSVAGTLTSAEAVAGLVVVPNVSLGGISCFSKDQCVAVGVQDGEGAVVSITDGIPGSVEAVDGTYGLDSVDCVSATTCYAVGTAPFRNPPEPTTTGGVDVSIVNGTAVAVLDAGAPNFGPGAPGYESLNGIACSNTSACIEVGYSNVFGGFAVDASNGEPGEEQNFLATGPNSANSIECVTGGSCMVNADAVAGAPGQRRRRTRRDGQHCPSRRPESRAQR